MTRPSLWSDVLGALRDHPALSIFSFFCCIPVVLFAPDLSPRARRGLGGGWAALMIGVALAAAARGAMAG